MTKLIEVTIHVRDVDRSRRFYQKLGAPCGDVSSDAPGDAPHVHAVWGEWSKGSNDFLMLNINPVTGAEPPAPASLGFATEDLDALHAALVADRVAVVHGPEARPWGRTAAYRDPDGNLVSVSQLPR